MTRYRRWAERVFVRPSSPTYAHQLRAELADRVLEIEAQLDAAGPAAVGSDWHTRAVSALCYRRAELEVLDEYLATLPTARYVEATTHPARCRCALCVYDAFAGRGRP